MADVSDIKMHRDGGTIEFRVSGSDVDGLYRLQTPFKGTPQPLFRDGRMLDFGSHEEVAVLGVLRAWQAEASTDAVVAAMAELDRLKEWFNLPKKLAAVVPLHRVRTVIQRLRERCV
jgi:hypothetical protein